MDDIIRIDETSEVGEDNVGFISDTEETTAIPREDANTLHIINSSTNIQENHGNVFITQQNDNLCKDAHGFRHPSAEDSASLLEQLALNFKKRYRRELKKIRPISWLDEVDLDLLELYVSRIIYDRTNRKTYSNGILEVFETTLPALPRRLILLGERGIGRRFTANQLALSWSVDEGGPLSHFQCVILLQENDLRKGSIKNIILRKLQVNHPEVRREMLWMALLQCAEEILFVIDGYEKVDEKCREEIDMFLVEDELSNCCIFLTASSFCKPSLPNQCSKKVLDLCMFTEDAARKCIVNYFRCRHEDADAANELLRWFQSKKEIRELAKCPLYNAMLCIFFDKDISSHRASCFDITGTIVNCLLEEIPGPQFENRLCLRHRLEKLAYESSRKGKSFSQESLEQTLRDKRYVSVSMRSGLLKRDSSIVDLKQISTYAFEMEQTQHFLASSFVANCSRKDFKKIVKRSASYQTIRPIVIDSFRLVDSRTEAKARLDILMSLWRRGSKYSNSFKGKDDNLTMATLSWKALKLNKSLSDTSSSNDGNSCPDLSSLASALPSSIAIVVGETNSEDRSVPEFKEDDKVCDEFIMKLLQNPKSSCRNLKVHIPSELTSESKSNLELIFRGNHAPWYVTFVSSVANSDIIETMLSLSRSSKVAIYLSLGRNWTYACRIGGDEDLSNFLHTVVSQTTYVKRIAIGSDQPMKLFEKNQVIKTDNVLKNNPYLQSLSVAVPTKQCKMDTERACGKHQNVTFFVASDMASFERYVSNTPVFWCCG